MSSRRKIHKETKNSLHIPRKLREFREYMKNLYQTEWVEDGDVEGKGSKRRKPWDDPLIDEANKRQTRAQRKLRSRLRVIARTKYNWIPWQIIEEFQSINNKVRWTWVRAPRGGKRGPRLSSHEEEVIANYEIRNPGIVSEDLRGPWNDTMYNRYVLDLIPKLRDENWVEALRECPGCGKLFLSKAKKRKYCSDRCKKKIWARENRRRVYCVGENREITLLICKDIQKEYPCDECPTCQNLMKKESK